MNINKKKVFSILVLSFAMTNGICKNVYAKPINQTNEQKLYEIDNKIANSTIQLDNMLRKEKGLKENIEKNTEKIKKLNEDIDSTQKNLNAIIRNDYINSYDNNFLAFLLESKSFSDFFNRIDTIKEIVELKNDQLKSIEKNKKTVNDKKNELEKNSKTLEILKKDKEKEIQNLETEKKEVQKLINQEKLQLNLEHMNAEIAQSKDILNSLYNDKRPSRGSMDMRRSIINYASSFIGTPYVWGGETPSGFDCSGFMKYVFDKYGISIPRVSESQQLVGVEVPLQNALPGDLIFFGYPAHHVGMYIGNGYYIHAPHTGDVIRISPVKNFTNIKRIIR